MHAWKFPRQFTGIMRNAIGFDSSRTQMMIIISIFSFITCSGIFLLWDNNKKNAIKKFGGLGFTPECKKMSKPKLFGNAKRSDNNI